MSLNSDNRVDMNSGNAGSLNGVSYKRLKSRSRAGDIRFNNGEPVNLAVRKIICQLMVIILTIIVVFGIFIVKEKVIDKITDDSFFTLSMSKKYGTPVGIQGISIAPLKNAPAYAVVEAIAAWNGQSDVKASALLSKNSKDSAETPDGLLAALKENIKGIDISVKGNLANYDYLTEIYDSVAAGESVVVPLAISENESNPKPDTYGYGIVTGVDFGADKISVLDFFGKTKVYTAEKFIDATRFKNFESMPISLKLSYTFGFRERNTVFAINKTK